MFHAPYVIVSIQRNFFIQAVGDIDMYTDTMDLGNDSDPLCVEI